jgi:Family of unknown function (DUF6879)
MEKLTAEQWDELFSSFEHEALHLEMRDIYTVPSEREPFRKWQAGEPDDLAWREPWLNTIRRVTRTGRSVRRVRIISEPVTDYVRWEWELTAGNVEAGEAVRWLPRRLASRIALPGNDFWVFDDQTAVFICFTGDGDSAGHELTTDPAAIELCKSAFDVVWPTAIRHHDYKPG